MKKTNPLIKLLPHGRTIHAESGRSLLETFIHHGIFVRSDCGGKGVCSKCRVKIIADDGTVQTVESCEYVAKQDISVQIPESAMLTSHVMTKAPVIFPETFKDRFKYAQDEGALGIAVDLGTTTIAVYLCNAAKGEVVFSVAVKNPQAIYGDDVMSRIGMISRDSDNLKKMQSLVVKSIEWGINELLDKLNDQSMTVDKMVVVGNPTMIHILAGIDPKPIGISPYLPVFYDAASFNAREFGFGDIHSKIYTLPQISGFIGADILAAAMAVDLEQQPRGTLLIDLGTNGELILKGPDTLYATSCATGPAFEGASLSCGMQATPGAINAVTIDENQKVSRISVINPKNSPEMKPGGICGAGVLNITAQLRERNMIAPDGRFVSQQKQFILVSEDKTNGRPSVHISQKDIRSIQLGKSALISGIEFLLEKAGLKTPEKIIIAGAFGSHLNPSDLVRLGIIPEIDAGKIEMSGNAAGSGAVMALCSKTYIEYAARMASKVKVVNLAADSKFQEVFVKNLGFPE